MRFSLQHLLGWATIVTVACWYVVALSPVEPGEWWLTLSTPGLALALMAVVATLGVSRLSRGMFAGAWFVCAISVAYLCAEIGSAAHVGPSLAWEPAALLFVTALIYAMTLGGGLELTLRGHAAGIVLLSLVALNISVVVAVFIQGIWLD